jgi:hypothetical protein
MKTNTAKKHLYNMKKYLIWFKNNKIYGIITLIGIFIISFGNFFESIDKIYLYTKKVFLNEKSDADLLISPIDKYVTSLDGHPSIETKDGKIIFTGGLKVPITLSHNKADHHSILIREININIVNFDPDIKPNYSYRIDPNLILGSGTIYPKIYYLQLDGYNVDSIKYIEENDIKKMQIYSGKNLLKTDPPRFIKIDSNDDIEEIYLVIVAQQNGLYDVSFRLNYSIYNEDRFKNTEKLTFYFYE